MDSKAVVCAYLFIFVRCLYDVLCDNVLLPSPSPVDSAPALFAVMVVVAHPVVSKLLICALPRLSAVFLSRPVPGPYDLSVLPSNGCDVNIGLLLPWPTMHLQKPTPHPVTLTPQKFDWLFRWRLPAVLRSYFLLAPLVAPFRAHILYHLMTALLCAVCDWLCCGGTV